MAFVRMTNVLALFLPFFMLQQTEKCAIKFIIWILHRDIILYNEVGANLELSFFFLHVFLYFVVNFAGQMKYCDTPSQQSQSTIMDWRVVFSPSVSLPLNQIQKLIFRNLRSETMKKKKLKKKFLEPLFFRHVFE